MWSLITLDNINLHHLHSLKYTTNCYLSIKNTLRADAIMMLTLETNIYDVWDTIDTNANAILNTRNRNRYIIIFKDQIRRKLVTILFIVK
jgi:hypothetical protein